MIALIIDNQSWMTEYRGSIKHNIRAASGESTIDTLMRLVEAGNVRIILPVIVAEEWHRHKDDPKTHLAGTINHAVRDVRRLVEFLSDDAGSTLDSLLSPDRFDRERISEIVDRRGQVIEDLFDHPSSVRVETNNESMRQAVEAALKKRAPFHQVNKNSMADALILFSAFEHVRYEGYEKTLFVSDNTKDFADQNNLDQIHPDLKALFDETGARYFRSLTHALSEIPESNISEQAIAEAEKELAVPSYAEEGILLNQVIQHQLLRIADQYQEKHLAPLNEFLRRLSEQERKRLRAILDTWILNPGHSGED